MKFHYRLDFDDGTFKRYKTIKEIETELNISNFTIHKCVREKTTTRKCKNVLGFYKDVQPTYLLVPNTN